MAGRAGGTPASAPSGHRGGGAARLHLGSAYASRAEASKGSIEAGKLADFAVLSEDPTRVSPGRIAAPEVLATIIGGEVRHDVTGLAEQAGEAGAVGAGAR